MKDHERHFNPRVIAGTLDGFEGFRRFQSAFVDPLRNLLPVAVEVENVAPELLRHSTAVLCARGFLVDESESGRGRLRIAASLDRFQLLPANGAARPAVEAALEEEFHRLAAVVARAVEARFTDTFVLPGRRRELTLGRRPLVLGVLNLTPDSFSDGGRYVDPDRAVERAFEMVEEGVDALDVGAESTRPGARPLSVEDEVKRLLPVLRVLLGRIGVPVSIDTMKAEVAQRFLDMGAEIVNDVSGLDFDARMADVVARSGALLIINHMRGTPRTMQESPRYDDVVAEIAASLRERLARAVEAGVPRERVILDPGIGFGKRAQDNLELLARIGELRSLGRPLLLGCSRKSFLGEITGKGVEARGLATAATTALAALRGAKMVRVHDVGDTLDVLRVLDAVDGRLRFA